MSGSDEAEAGRIRARQDKLARSEARRAKMARQAAREEAALAEQLAAQHRIVAEAKAARASGAMPTGGGTRRTRPSLARAGQQPVLGTRSVDDPLALEPGRKLTAIVNLSEHPLEMMLARRRLSPAQYEAGVRFRFLYEKASIGPGRGVDLSRIRVDGGRMGDPLTDAVIHAHRELARIMPMLGKRGSAIVVAVCGLGKGVSDLAAHYDGYDSVKQNIAFITLRLKEALDVLAEEVWGARGPDRARIVGKRDLGSGFVDMQAVEAANQSHLRKHGVQGLE